MPFGVMRSAQPRVHPGEWGVPSAVRRRRHTFSHELFVYEAALESRSRSECGNDLMQFLPGEQALYLGHFDLFPGAVPSAPTEWTIFDLELINVCRRIRPERRVVVIDKELHELREAELAGPVSLLSVITLTFSSDRARTLSRVAVPSFRQGSALGRGAS